MKNMNRKIKHKVYASITLACIVAIALLFNYLITKLDNKYNLSLDMTGDRLYSLSGATYDAIENINDDIFIYTTETAGIEDANVQQLLKSYAAASNKIHITNIDIVKNPASIEYYTQFSDYDVVAGNIIVSNSPNTNDTEQKYKILGYNQLYNYNYESETYNEFTAEDAVTGAIKHISNPVNQKVWILDNHSSDSDYRDVIKNILENETYAVELLDILNGQNPLDSKDIVILIDIESDLTDTEYEILSGYLSAGGKMIISLSPILHADRSLYNLMSLAEQYNIKLGQGMVMESDLNNVAVSSDSEYIYSFIIPEYEDHEITRDFQMGDYKLLLGSDAGYLILPEKINRENLSVSPILSTADTSYIKPLDDIMDGKPNNDTQYGEYTVMAAVEDGDTKVIVLSASGLLANAEEYSKSVYKNKDFLLKSIAWLSGEDDEFYISGKPLNDSPLMIETMKQAYAIIAVVCVIIPLIIFGFGIFIFVKRNNL